MLTEVVRYLPEWMPGAGFKKIARQWHATAMELAEKPMRFVKQEMVTGHHESSFVSRIYDQVSENGMSPEHEHVTKWSAGSLYAGGADTVRSQQCESRTSVNNQQTVSTMATFFLAMTIHPEVQQKAREEIDRVVGTHRLPTFSDRESLPYVEAVLKESFRWQPIGPMGVPHVASQDDVFDEYLIPKGAMMLPNIW